MIAFFLLVLFAVLALFLLFIVAKVFFAILGVVLGVVIQILIVAALALFVIRLWNGRRNTRRSW